MVQESTVRSPRFTIRSVERSLAGAFVVLLGTYALGTLASGRLPLLRNAGVVAVHVAVLVAALLGVALVAHAVLGAVVDDRSVPTTLEVVALAVVAGSLALTTVAPRSVSDALFWTAVGGSLVLTGLVLADR